MKVIICEDYNELSEKASEIIKTQVISKPNSILGLATGSSPIGMYKNLINLYENEIIDFSNVTTFNLDEYYNLEKQNEQSYYNFMNENLFNHINIKSENTHIPNGMANNIEQECENYDNLIEEIGGVDVQVLGIGRNAHIGFNEPGESFKNGTHLVDLKESTIQANSRFFESIEEVPRKAITMGIGTIFKSKKIILLATGESKAEAIYNTVYGEITPKVPSSIIKLHKDVVIIVDKMAGKLL